jgi:ABC-type glutathione transport system ATPase component
VSGAPLVALSGVGKRFANGVEALAGLDLEIGPSEFLAVLGPSGCGKSTALRLIAGLAAPSQGRIVWDRAAEAATRAPGGIGFVFQEPTLMPWSSALGNAMLPLRLAGVPRAEAEARAGGWAAGGGGGPGRRRARRGRPRRFRARRAARIVGGHAHARVDRARPRHPAAAAVDGRAVRRARRDHALEAQR